MTVATEVLREGAGWLNHPAEKDGLVFRYNEDLERWEFWAWYALAWVAHNGNPSFRSLFPTVRYQDTYLEPVLP